MNAFSVIARKHACLHKTSHGIKFCKSLSNLHNGTPTLAFTVRRIWRMILLGPPVERMSARLSVYKCGLKRRLNRKRPIPQVYLRVSQVSHDGGRVSARLPQSNEDGRSPAGGPVAGLCGE